MADFATPESTAEWLSKFKLTSVRQDTDPDDPYRRYSCELSGGTNFAYGSPVKKEHCWGFTTSLLGEPTVAQVMADMAHEVDRLRSLGERGYLDSFGPSMRHSDAFRAYEAAKSAFDWMLDYGDGLGMAPYDFLDLWEMLAAHLPEVDLRTQAIQKDAAAQDLFENPPAPEGFRTIADVCEDLDLGDWGGAAADFGSGDYIDEAFAQIADDGVDDSLHDLLAWLPENYEWLEQVNEDGRLEGVDDFGRMIQIAQEECYRSDLDSHRGDVCAYVALQSLKDSGIWAISEEVADDVVSEASDCRNSRFFHCIDVAEACIESALVDGFKQTYGEEVLADNMAEHVTALSYGVPNGVAMDRETVRRVNELGYAAAYDESWKDFLEAELGDVEPPAVADAAKECAEASVGLDAGREAQETSKDAR